MEKKKEKFTMYFIIFTIIAAIITATAIYFTITEHNKKVKEEQSKINQEITNENIQVTINNETTAEKITEKPKKIAEDSKYKINSYDETYNTNALKYTYYLDVDGKETQKSSQYEYLGIIPKNYQLEYVQIEGLKDKNIQEKVNTKLKQEAYKLMDENLNNITTNINSSFSNIISIDVTGYGKNQENKMKCINIDLTTGEEIPFEKIFVSSAPLNSLLAEGLYKMLAWNVDLSEDNAQQYLKNHNMDKRDTSEYEDKFLLFIENYQQEKEKNNIQFGIFANQVILYDIVSPEIEKGIQGNKLSISIEFAEHMEDIAIYKRYLKQESIFENDELSNKNIVVFTENPQIEGYRDIVTYGMLNDHIFAEEVINRDNQIEESIYTKMLEYVKTKSKEQQNKIKTQVPNDKAMFYQVEYQANKMYDKEGYQITAIIGKATCSLEYFKTNGFKDFVELNNKPSAGAELKMFNYYEEFINFDASIDYEDYYFDKDGNIL